MHVIIVLCVLTGCEAPEPPPSPVAAPAAAAKHVSGRHKALFGKLPTRMESPGRAKASAELIALGRVLYYDPRLSVSNTISCNTCHPLDRFGVDNQPKSPGHDGARGRRNAPSTYNAAGHKALHWDGSQPDVETQAGRPILDPLEMGMPDEASVEAKLAAIEGYPALFAAAFPGVEPPLTFGNLETAIGAFERGLVTPGPLDAYLAGDAEALTHEQRTGLEAFVRTGCTTCHLGPYVGGSSFQQLGLVTPYVVADEGRFAVTGNPTDLHVFKPPSLRNVAQTAPYLHDGSVSTLPEVIGVMARHQLGKQLEPSTVDAIVAFLQALTGEIPSEYVARPPLPGITASAETQ
ncbi:MAG: cytochrome c peroxidase [Myxococcota bacterium]